MTLCRSSRCGCTVTSSTLQVTGKAGGVGYNIETYEGVATEVPDTRPGPGERFEGMRVWTTDTKRLFVWNDTTGDWDLLSEPPQDWLPTAVTQGVSVAGTATAGSWYQRHQGVFRGNLEFTASGTGTAGQVLRFPLPEEVINITEVRGTAQITDIGVIVYAGVVTPRLSTTEAAIVVDGNTDAWGASPSVAFGPSDNLRVFVSGRYI